MGLLRGGKEPAPTLGYSQGLEESYDVSGELGKGGSGIVRRCVHRQTGKAYAVKSIPKVLTDPGVSEAKRGSHLTYLKREVEVMLALRGTLNVACLEAVYEDSTHVHMVLELCTGGELVARAKDRHYSERTVASFMRAVLRTVAQCHQRNILHRDIKPENFLLLSEEVGSPVKAIDFGLAVFFDPDKLPVTQSNVEGTPWYLAPESCRARWFPASDVWACGVMAAYLLTGKYPFVDRLNPTMPDLARTLRHICFDPLDLSGPEWVGLSEEARAFVSALLVKDPLQRPSATAALAHPWLARRAGKGERSRGLPLDRSVVQRLQRFGTSSLFKRTVLQHIAQDLVAMHFGAGADRSAHGAAVFADRSVRGAAAFFADRSLRGADAFFAERTAHSGSLYVDRSVHSGSAFGERSAHHGALFADRSAHRGAAFADRDRSLRGASAFGDRSVRRVASHRERSQHGGSMHDGGRRGDSEASAHGGGTGAAEGEALEVTARSVSATSAPPEVAGGSWHGAGSAVAAAPPLPPPSVQRSGSLLSPFEQPATQGGAEAGSGVGGQLPGRSGSGGSTGLGEKSRGGSNALAALVQEAPDCSVSGSAALPPAPSGRRAISPAVTGELPRMISPTATGELPTPVRLDSGTAGGGSSDAPSRRDSAALDPGNRSASAALASLPLGRTASGASRAQGPPPAPLLSRSASGRLLERSVRAGAVFLERSLRGGSAFFGLERTRSGRVSEAGAMARMESGVYLPVATPYSHRLAQLFDRLGLQSGKELDQAALTKALQEIGYQITDDEGAELFSILDTERQGQVGQAELSAGLIDWKSFQDTYADRWVESVRRVFAEMDTDGSGTLTAEEIAASFGAHLSPYEVDAAVHQALLEAAGGDEGAPGIDFDAFLRLLREGDGALSDFDDRLSNHTSRHNTGDLSYHAARALSKGKRGGSGMGGGGGGGGGCACSVQ